MYTIHFYRTRNGREPVLDYLRELKSRKDKASRVTLNQMLKYIQYLRNYGTRAGSKIVKHLDGEIWELRPDRNRILFAAWLCSASYIYETDAKNAAAGD